MIQLLATAFVSQSMAVACPIAPIDDEALPSVQSVLNRAIDAMGGRENLEAIEIASYSVNSQWHNQLYIVRGRDDLLRLSLSAAADERMRRRGDFGWILNMEVSGGMDARLIARAELDVEFPLTFHRQVLDLLPHAESAHVGSTGEIGETPYIEVIFPLEAGKRHMYFCADTGLPLQMQLRYSRFNLEFRSTFVYGNWNEQAGIKVFRTLGIGFGGDHFEDQYHEAIVIARFGPVDETLFDDPLTILDLVRHHERIAAARQVEAAINEMTADEARDELVRIAHERRRTRGTPEQLPLRIEFELLMERMRRLNVQDTRG